MINLKELLNDHQTGMSDFQDDYLVTARAGGTTYGQYKQSLREVYKRFRGLRDLIYGEKGKIISEIEIEELQEQFDKAEGKEKEKLDIKLKYKIMLMEECDRIINDTYREFMRFYQQAHYLKEQIGELTPERRRELDADMWKYRAKEMAAIDYMQTGRLKNTTIEFISVMPKEIRNDIYKLVLDPNKHTQLIDEYMNREDVHQIPFEDMKIPRLDINELTKLIELKGEEK